MGKELKRVPLDFNWPLRMEWKGYINPYSAQNCEMCDGSGYNPETKQISDDWYAFENPERRWSDKLTQDEVDALVEENRLQYYFPDDHRITAEEINALCRKHQIHDVINRWICVETRARRLGVWGVCPLCDGEGVVWFSDEIRRLSENWEMYDPPTGEGWQVWETVSNGSPISPVFATSEELVQWLISGRYSENAARAFIEKQYCFSASFDPDCGFRKDLETLVD